MDFIKKHYEKIFLSLVLLGVMAALGALPVVIQGDNEARDNDIKIFNQKPKDLNPLNLSRQTALLDRLQSPYDLDLSNTNKLFNPVVWKKNPVTGELIKVTTGHEVDASAAVVTSIIPLYLVISLKSVETNTGVRYEIMIERQAAATRSARAPVPKFATLNEKIKEANPAFTIIRVMGADPAAPEELDLKLDDTGETAVVAPGKPFKRPDAYQADLKYDPERKVFRNVRQGTQLTQPLGGETYNVVLITANDVTLSALSNSKKTILHYAP
jgi:hypothetical protein